MRGCCCRCGRRRTRRTQPSPPGDCPFSQRAFMCLKYKNAEFDVRYIDLDNKPEE